MRHFYNKWICATYQNDETRALPGPDFPDPCVALVAIWLLALACHWVGLWLGNPGGGL